MGMEQSKKGIPLLRENEEVDDFGMNINSLRADIHCFFFFSYFQNSLVYFLGGL